MVREFNVYAVYEKGKLVCEGTCYEISQKLDVPEKSICVYWRKKTKMKGIYTVEFVGKTKQKTKYYKGNPSPRAIRKVEKEFGYDETPYECLLWHLKKYGNTSTPFDPNKYMGRLKDEGLECRITPIKNVYEDGRSGSTRGRKAKPSYHYYVEVVA